MVDTAVRPPGAPPSDGGAVVGRPHRRSLRWVAIGTAAALAVVIALGAILVSNYQPLRAGFKQYGAPSGVRATTLKIDWLDAPPNVQTFQIPAYKGLTFTYKFSLWNHGPTPVTIAQFGTPASQQAGDGILITPVAIDPNVYGGGGWQPVPEAISLGPRQMAGVEMRVTVTSCMGKSATAKWNKILITFSVYGIERHVFAPMNVQISLIGTQSAC